MLSRTTASCTCASSFSPCKGQVCTSRRSIRVCASLIFAAHVASRLHKLALTVQEQVMTLAHAHARLREEHFARKKPYGVCLERVSPRRRGNAHAISPWFSTPIVKQHPPKVIEGACDASDAQRFDHNKVTKLYPT